MIPPALALVLAFTPPESDTAPPAPDPAAPEAVEADTAGDSRISDATWESVEGSWVTLERAEGNIEGRVRSVADTVVVLSQRDGRIVEVPKASVSGVRLSPETPPTDDEPAPVTPGKPDAGSQTVPTFRQSGPGPEWTMRYNRANAVMTSGLIVGGIGVVGLAVGGFLYADARTQAMGHSEDPNDITEQRLTAEKVMLAGGVVAGVGLIVAAAGIAWRVKLKRERSLAWMPTGAPGSFRIRF